MSSLTCNPGDWEVKPGKTATIPKNEFVITMVETGIQENGNVLIVTFTANSDTVDGTVTGSCASVVCDAGVDKCYSVKCDVAIDQDADGYFDVTLTDSEDADFNLSQTKAFEVVRTFNPDN
ncbi:MAG: hypothetical protein GY761_00765 [Hyphomicrobiales bacterium]|nr:hypothetical protein [Hyphomicrobiales bacterium]